MDLIATLPLYPKYRLDVAAHPLVSALRFNTVTPRDASVQATVDGLLGACRSKSLWLDLKARQLRITEFAYLPESYVTINHKITVQTPCNVYFKDCSAQLEAVVDGNNPTGGLIDTTKVVTPEPVIPTTPAATNQNA